MSDLVVGRADYAHRYATNPGTLVSSPPGTGTVTVALDLRSAKVTLDYDLLHAEALHRELGVAIELANRKPYTHARRKDEPWTPR